MTKAEITAIADTIKGLMTSLRYATPQDRAEIYAGINLRLTYNPGPRTVGTRADIGQTCTKGSCPRGECTQKPMRAHR
jgi:site-specific DNA recombinase